MLKCNFKLLTPSLLAVTALLFGPAIGNCATNNFQATTTEDTPAASPVKQAASDKQAASNTPAAPDKPTALNKPAAPAAPNQDTLESELAAKLTGSRWTGQFSVIGTGDKLTRETYEIIRAKKSPDDDYWLLIARIKYGEHDVTLPLPPIEIKWAGQTPVITLDDLAIPGMGTFDARVLIRGNRYSGTWSHNDKGGHLFGTIEKIKQ